MHLRVVALLGFAACVESQSPPVAAPTRRRGAEPEDRTYYATIGFPHQSFGLSTKGALQLGQAWVAIGQSPYALVSGRDREVELLSPLDGPTIAKNENFDEPIGTVRKHLVPSDRKGYVETSFDLVMLSSSIDAEIQRNAKLEISLDAFQPCNPIDEEVAKQIEVRQTGCFLEPSNKTCAHGQTLAAQPDGTFAVGPVRVSVRVVCIPMVYEL